MNELHKNIEPLSINTNKNTQIPYIMIILTIKFLKGNVKY